MASPRERETTSAIESSPISPFPTPTSGPGLKRCIACCRPQGGHEWRHTPNEFQPGKGLLSGRSASLCLAILSSLAEKDTSSRHCNVDFHWCKVIIRTTIQYYQIQYNPLVPDVTVHFRYLLLEMSHSQDLLCHFGNHVSKPWFWQA